MLCFDRMGAIMNDRDLKFLEMTSEERAEATLAEMAQRVADGEKLTAVCSAWGIPHSRFAAWISDKPEREGIYRAAQRLRADALISDNLTIAATTQEGQTVKEGPDGIVTTTEDMLGHRKLQIETNFKVAARWDPARFGDSQRVELTARQKPSEVTMLESARRVAFTMARGAHLAQQSKRAPRLLEGSVSTVAGPTDSEGDPV